MTEEDAQRAAMAGDWKEVTRYLTRLGLAYPADDWWLLSVEMLRAQTPIPAPMPSKCEQCHDQIRIATDLQTKHILDLVRPSAMLIRGAPITNEET